MKIKIEKIEGKEFSPLLDEAVYDKINTADKPLVSEICQNINEIYLLTFPYGGIVWQNDKFLGFDDGTNKRDFDGERKTKEQFEKFCKRCHYPIGIILKGVFEIFRFHYSVRERSRGDREEPTQVDIKRRHVDTLLKPGNIFGLFESFANLHGPWVINAGVQSFMISNYLGDSKKAGSYAKSFKHTKFSDYDFTKFIKTVNINDWDAKCLIFDPKVIKNKDLVFALNKITVEQLVSLIQQNPQSKFWDSDENIYFNDRSTARTLDAIIEGDIPLYTLATDEDKQYFPYHQLNENIKKVYKNSLKTSWIDVWRPCLLSPSRKIGVYFPKLANKFNRGSISDLISMAGNEAFGKKTDGRRGVIYQFNDKKMMIYTTKKHQINARILKYGRESNLEKNTENIDNMVQLFFHPEKRNNWGYKFPPYLREAFVIELML